jgi:DNA repair protein RadC
MPTTPDAPPSSDIDTDEVVYIPTSSPPPVSQQLLVNSAADVYAAMEDIRHQDREHLIAFHLTVRHRLLRRRTVHIGTLTGVECHPREIFRGAILGAAAAIIVAHNHPSGDPTPSRDDIALTNRLREVGELCGIPVLDHVIVSDGGYVSMAERRWR